MSDMEKEMRETTDSIYENFTFQDYEVIDADGWEFDGDATFSRKVFASEISGAGDDDSVAINFVVDFSEGIDSPELTVREEISGRDFYNASGIAGGMRML